MTLMQTHGVPNVPCKKGPNSVRNGINTVAARLAPDAEGKPHLVIHDCCTALIKEIESYRWDTGRSKGDMADAPLKKADHAIDALRYALSMFERSGYV
jgi:phage terminase large subunit